jgi:sulfatase maturation enzyme AslB (radical SAM superfamily)
MECKFIKHGIALSYDQIVKPCCVWKISPEWRQINHIRQVDLQTWHQSTDVLQAQHSLDMDIWPKACDHCEKIESQGRADSIRGNGLSAYANYGPGDITLEIRPGNVCNFACQTCWPEASTRVAQYHSQAGLIDIKNLDSNRLDDFDLLLPIASRIKDVILLGGEPFYDKSCLKFLSWAKTHLGCHIMLFTNGSVIDLDFLKNYGNKITVIFSLDAVGRPAEYIRYGTEWSQVLQNYHAVRSLPNVECRVNITCSVYNYVHLEQLLDLLCEDWPSVVSFGQAFQDYMQESVVPWSLRAEIKASLTRTIDRLSQANISSDQKANAVNAVTAIRNNLDQVEFDADKHSMFVDFVSKMDQVKRLRAADYCEFLGALQQQVT